MPGKIARFKNTLFCSFCGDSEDEVEQLIAGSVGAYICDACVDRCAKIVADARAQVAKEQAHG